MRTSASSLAAVLVGNPAVLSLSPVIHMAWITAAELDATYFVAELEGDNFRQFVRARGPIVGLGGANLRGLNVTIPFKEEALAVAHQASARAQRAGAANLLLFEPGGTV
ncbi:MAG TPA: shikimate dehydrogenase, partial [Caulobacteraceae bacterium]